MNQRNVCLPGAVKTPATRPPAPRTLTAPEDEFEGVWEAELEVLELDTVEVWDMVEFALVTVATEVEVEIDSMEVDEVTEISPVVDDASDVTGREGLHGTGQDGPAVAQPEACR